MEAIKKMYEDNIPRLETFRKSVITYFEEHSKKTRAIHSIKSRLKDPNHIIDKIERKSKVGKKIDENNLFDEIRDLIGIRILHLYQDQFSEIHQLIEQQIIDKEWKLMEAPKAYSWDPEITDIYKSLEIETEVRDTFYTSVHYIIAPNNNNPKPICCEIQVRTLFEEVWGEIDHTINYPNKTEILACKEQLRVLSKLVSTGTRLADSIFRSYNDLSKT